MDPATISAGAAVVVAYTPLAHHLLKRMLGPVADEVGGHWGREVRDYFARNREKAINRAAEMVHNSGVAPKTVPPRVVLAIAEGASKEDCEQLQEMWAALWPTPRSLMIPKTYQRPTPLS